MNTSLTRRSFTKRTRRHSFTALHRASDVFAADWRSETHVKNYDKFSRAVMQFFSGGEIPIKHFIKKSSVRDFGLWDARHAVAY